MKFPRMRFTLRRMIAVVAFMAILIWLAQTTREFLAALAETYYPATKQLARTWDAGPAPKVNVDLFSSRRKPTGEESSTPVGSPLGLTRSRPGRLHPTRTVTGGSNGESGSSCPRTWRSKSMLPRTRAQFGASSR